MRDYIQIYSLMGNKSAIILGKMNLIDKVCCNDAFS